MFEKYESDLHLWGCGERLKQVKENIGLIGDTKWIKIAKFHALFGELRTYSDKFYDLVKCPLF